jgi:hypothetical protein
VSGDLSESRILYRFSFADGRQKQFLVRLDHDTLSLIGETRESYPDWTALGHEQCPNCPLNVADHPRCPVARNLVDVVDAFRDELSFAEVAVEVETGERVYRKTAPLQEGLSALIGIVTVSSGCPVLDRLRPMVDTHLPFMSPEESTYRMITMHLLAQYFRVRRGETPDWGLDELVRLLAECRTTNAALVRRVQTRGIKDASLNALARLNTMGEITALSIDGDLERLASIFESHDARSRCS